MLITKVRINNFKRFEQLEMDLKPLDCLVGPNNSGKTTLLQALALFDFCVHHCLNRKNGDFEIKPRTIQPEDFYVLPVSDPMDLWTDRVTMRAKKQQRIEICVTFDGQQEVTATLKLDYNRLGLNVDSSDKSQEWYLQLSQYRIAYLPVFSAFLAQEERRTSAIIESELARGRVHTVIRNLLLDLKEGNRLEKLVNTLQSIFLSLKKMRIEFDEVSDRFISVVYQEAGRPKEFDVFSAGSGFQQFLYLLGFIQLRDPAVILLDEPDVHLHGVLQHALLSELQKLVAGGKQILFATHSRDLIHAVAPEDILSLEEEGAKRLSISYDVYDTLDKLGSVDPTQLPTIQAYRRVVIVENQTDWELLSTFCAKCLGEPLWREAEKRLAVCYSKGNPYKQDIARLRSQLQQLITLQGRTLETFVIADRDYYPDLEQLNESIRSPHIHWHVWERAEIENYLLCPEAILRLMQGKSALQLEEAAFREEYAKTLDESRDNADDRLAAAYVEYNRRLKNQWDAVTINRKAREYLQAHWNTEKVMLADAKDIVLPKIKKWLQDHHFGEFSNKSLADALTSEDLPKEVHCLAKELAQFAGGVVK